MNILNTTFSALMAAAVISTGTPALITQAKSSSQNDKSIVAEAKAEDKDPEAGKAPEPTAPQPKVVTVQPGDYLEKIATENASTSLRIFYANTEVANPDLIYPNQQLRVPTPEEVLTPREVPVNKQIAVPTADQATQAAAPRAVVTYSGDATVWDRLAACEAGGNWAINTGNGYYGGLQFTLGSWQGVGGSGLPSNASREEQIARGQALQARSGWGAWPACSAKLGLL